MAIVISLNSCLLDVRKEGSFVTPIHHVHSISHNIIKQGLTSVVNVRTSPGGVMRICITADDLVSSISTVTCHQLLQLPDRWAFNIIVWKVGRSENNLTRPTTTGRFNFLLPCSVVIFFFLRNPWPESTGVLEHFREGEINIFLLVVFRPHPKGDELTYETNFPHRANPVNYMNYYVLYMVVNLA